MNKQAHDRITAARIHVLQDHPFFGLKLIKLDLVEDSSHPDMWVDGNSLGYNPEWAMNASFEDLKFWTAHCACHCILCHPLRREGRDQKDWDEATDRVVNAILAKSGLRPPRGVIVHDGYEDKSAEESYHHVEFDDDGDKGKNKKKKQENGESGESGTGDDSDDESESDDKSDDSKSDSDDSNASDNKDTGEDSKRRQPGQCRDQSSDDGTKPSQSEKQEMEQDQAEELAALAQQAAAMGNLPACISRMVDAMLNKKMDWKEELAEYLLSFDKSDYSWSRPNRRFINKGLYLPSLQADGAIDHMILAIDTSESVDQKKLSSFVAELNGILEQVTPSRITVILCSSYIKDVIELTHSEPFSHEIYGGGGTDLCPPFEWVEENGESPDLLVYFTDLQGPKPVLEPDYPVVWIDQTGTGDGGSSTKEFIEKYGMQSKGYWAPKFGRVIAIP